MVWHNISQSLATFTRGFQLTSGRIGFEGIRIQPTSRGEFNTGLISNALFSAIYSLVPRPVFSVLGALAGDTRGGWTRSIIVESAISIA